MAYFQWFGFSSPPYLRRGLRGGFFIISLSQYVYTFYMIYNNKNLEVKRKMLRNNPTQQEIIVWNYLKNKNMGYKFRRQQSIGNYIVDFYCRERNIIIEIDGIQHKDNEIYDIQRTTYLEGLGYRVMRFWNSEVNTNLENVLQKIYKELHHP